MNFRGAKRATSAFLRPHTILDCVRLQRCLPGFEGGGSTLLRRVSTGLGMRWFAWVVVFCGTAIGSVVAHANSNAEVGRFMRVHGQSLPPYGFVQFCKSFKKECVAHHASTRRFDATPARLSELDEVNRRVNLAVTPATDRDIYGVDEYWTLPGKYGDCEDYVLLKRRTLMLMGWPSSSLLITVVRDERGEGHAVLTARTQQGDFVLDNKVNDVKLWSETPYSYIMRQSYLNPTVWVSLDPRATASPEAIAGLRARK